jgi:hypothetical protein
MEPRRPLPPAPAWAPAVPGPARETEAGARGEGAARVTPQAAASQFGSTRAQRGPGSSGSHTAGRGKLVGEHLGYRVGLPILAGAGGPGSSPASPRPSAPPGSPRAPSDPGPHPGKKVSAAAGARKTRSGILRAGAGRERNAAQTGKLSPRRRRAFPRIPQ